MAKAVNLYVSIGDLTLARKCIKDFSIDRNFSDVANKFQMTLVDYYGVNGTDLELYMNAGHRTIQISYSDSEQEQIKFSGQILDYTNNFVGNIKSLVITGIASRVSGYDYSGKALYNIDWNAYYNARPDEYNQWNVMYMQDQESHLYTTWYKANKNITEASKKELLGSPILNAGYRQVYNSNSVMLKVQGPGGSIDLPLPDSFMEMQGPKAEEIPNKWGNGAIAATGSAAQAALNNAKPHN